MKNVHCPKCGSSAKFVSHKAHTIDFGQVFYRCENPKCGGEVVAEVTFSMRKTPAEQCFSSNVPDVGDQIKTDC